MISDTSIRIGLAGGVLSAFLILAGALSSICAQQPADTSSTTASPKPKKVWTNDDLTPGDTAATAKPTPAPAPPVKTTTPQPANQLQLRTKLEKLQAQWKDAEAQRDRLKRFASGDSSGDAGRQLHKGYNMEPIPDQIAKLEEKMHQLQLQIDAIYDEARKKGIPAGDLR
jgi:type IV secretory pathway VirB10-like protein